MMFAQQATSLMSQALWLVLVLSGPPIAAAALVGLVIAIVQSATQLQDQTIQYAAKFLAIGLTLFACMGLMGGALLGFGEQIFTAFPTLVRP
jgi:type III secretion protein S